MRRNGSTGVCRVPSSSHEAREAGRRAVQVWGRYRDGTSQSKEKIHTYPNLTQSAVNSSYENKTKTKP